MRRGLAAAAVSAVVALSFGAATATAAPPNPPVVTGGTLSVAMSPGNTNPPLLSGHFHVDDSGSAVTIKATMSWTGPDPDHHPKFNPVDVCTPPCTPDGNGNVDFAGFKLPAADFNGPYHVAATATATDPPWGSGSGPAAADFQVAVPPPNVTNVTAAVDNKSRVVTVSFDRGTTPDLQAYYVWRKGPGDKDFVAIFQTPQQPSGARISVGDEGTASKGGDYQYNIGARRNGPDGMYSSTDFVASEHTAKESQSNKVTVPPPPPGQTAPPTTAPKGGAPPLVKGTPSGVNRNSSFSGSGSSSATTPTSEAVTPDPGFVRGLPFAGSNPNNENGEGDNSAVAVEPGRHSTTGQGWLKPVAGAAVLVLGALHLRLLKKRLDEPPSNTLTPVA